MALFRPSDVSPVAGAARNGHALSYPPFETETSETGAATVLAATGAAPNGWVVYSKGSPPRANSGVRTFGRPTAAADSTLGALEVRSRAIS